MHSYLPYHHGRLRIAENVIGQHFSKHCTIGTNLSSDRETISSRISKSLEHIATVSYIYRTRVTIDKSRGRKRTQRAWSARGTADVAKSLGGCPLRACHRPETEHHNAIFCTYTTGRIVAVAPGHGPTISLFLSLRTQRTNGHVSRDISHYGRTVMIYMSYVPASGIQGVSLMSMISTYTLCMWFFIRWPAAYTVRDNFPTTVCVCARARVCLKWGLSCPLWLGPSAVD